ncbi:MAG: GAF domain-containing protein, partial [Desulfobacterales bacterium]|nr:GAF domain-containing protein [Desulfobacterales bacterium]
MATDTKKMDGATGIEKSLEEQLIYQKRLNTITNSIHSANDTNDILLNLQAQILSFFDADRITVYVLDSAKKEIVSRFKTGDEISEIRVPINNESISGYCAASGKLVNILNVNDQDELGKINAQLKFDKNWDQKTGYKTIQVLAAPVIHEKFLLGVIQLINKKTGVRFNQRDQTSVLDIAKVLGAAFLKNMKTAQKTRPTRFDFLITNNIISNNDLAKAMSNARKTKRTAASVLIDDFHVSKGDIGRSLADFYRTRFIPYDDNMAIPGQLLKGLKPGFLKNNGFVPVAQSGDKVVVVMADPNYLPARDAIAKFMPSKEFEYCVSLKEDINKMIDLFFDVKRSEMLQSSGSIEEILGQLDSVDDEDEDLDMIDEDDSTIVQLINKMIVDAYNSGASDIHIEPRPGKSPAVIR